MEIMAALSKLVAMLQQEMLSWTPDMRAACTGCTRRGASTVDARFRCAGHPAATLIARFALLQHCRSNVLYFMEDRGVPHARAVCSALAASPLPGALQRLVLQCLRVPRVLPLKAWLRQRLGRRGAAALRGAAWAPAGPLHASWAQVQRHLRRAGDQKRTPA